MMARPLDSTTPSPPAGAGARPNSSVEPMSPFERVLHFGERHAFPIILASLLSSTSVHYSFAYASTIVELRVKDDLTKVTCRAGENVQVEVSARARLGGFADATSAAQWATDDGLIAQSAGGGMLRCMGQGDTAFRVSYGGRSVVLPVHVDPAVMMVEQDEKKEEPPPPPPVLDKDPEPPPPSDTPKEKEIPNTTAAAKAGNLLTVQGPTQGDEPVSFVTDPNGTEYGSGTVMKGGTADKSNGGPVSSAPPSGSGKGGPTGPIAPPPPIQTGPDLSAPPNLPGGKSFCNGYFPNDADDDTGFVQLMIDVDPAGKVTKAVVVKESPKGQGFGKGARACLLSPRKINPALGRDGKPVAHSLTINLNFTR